MALTEVNSLGIKDLEVKTGDIAADAVTGAKIADDQIDSEHYVAASIDHEHLANDAVDGDNLADNACDSEHYTDGSVDIVHLANGTDGKIITWDANGAATVVGPGSDGQVLTSTGAGSPPAFETLPTSGATLSGSTDNTVVTVTGSNAMQGEANLTFTGTVLGLTGKMKIGTGMAAHDDANDFVISNDAAITGMSINNAADGYGCINFGDANDDDIGRIAYNHNGNHMTFAVNAGTRMEIEDTGDVKINDGNLIIGTDGHGIDFSATSDGGTSQDTELLDDYEEGVWTPTAENGCTGVGSYTPHYVKIGNLCTVIAYIHQIAGADGNTFRIGGLPYSVKSSKTGALGTVILHASDFPDNHMQTAVNSSAGNSYFQLFASRDDYAWYTWTGNDVEDGGTLVITLTYRTN